MARTQNFRQSPAGPRTPRYQSLVAADCAPFTRRQFAQHGQHLLALFGRGDDRDARINQQPVAILHQMVVGPGHGDYFIEIDL
jgi:hypothetical protein